MYRKLGRDVLQEENTIFSKKIKKKKIGKKKDIVSL